MPLPTQPRPSDPFDYPAGGLMRRKARQASKAENRPRFWGRHAVAAALANPERRIAPHLGDARGGGGARHPDRRSRSPSPTSPISAGWCRATRRIRASSPRSSGSRTSGSPTCSTRREDDRPAAGARPGHRSAQCRRDPALGRGVRRARHRHAGPARAARIRARWPRRPRARSRPCPGCASSISPARSTRSPRPASGGSG